MARILSRLHGLRRLARVNALRLGEAERLTAGLDREKAGIAAEALALRIMLASDRASCAPVDLLARRIATGDRRLALVEAQLEEARPRLMAEQRRLKLLEKAIARESLQLQASLDAAELDALIDRIASEHDQCRASLP